MKKWLADHWLELVSVAVVVGGSIVALAQQVTAMAQSNPWAFAFWTVAALGLGFLMGTRASELSALRVKLAQEAEQAERDRQSAERIAFKQAEEETRRAEEATERAREETRRVQMEADLEKEREERRVESERSSMIRNISALTDEMKYLLVEAREKGYLVLESSVAAGALGAKGMLVDFSTGAGFRKRWMLSDGAAEAMDDAGLAADISAAHDRHASVAREERLDAAEQRFVGMDLCQRVFAYRVWRDGSADLDEYNARDLDSGFLVREDVGGGRFRYRLAPEAVELFSERENSCFATVIEELERRGIDG